ncbi:hypothetical protein [Phytoactinopolyspora limicola]|nr:hypothetical protein [Phytoactinopolyspora limicola]
MTTTEAISLAGLAALGLLLAAARRWPPRHTDAPDHEPPEEDTP